MDPQKMVSPTQTRKLLKAMTEAYDRLGTERANSVTGKHLDHASLIVDSLGGQYAVSVVGDCDDTEFCATCVSDDPFSALNDIEGFLKANFKVCNWEGRE